MYIVLIADILFIIYQNLYFSIVLIVQALCVAGTFKARAASVISRSRLTRMLALQENFQRARTVVERTMGQCRRV
ncbi:hypothetical protein M408DRAFT_111686 [Serendipita vermifera MAFF 305830]|uniref:Uncharacterized protein n=1 Tax=Serendipita vermifera MAFF 305830 TaxID=933852 RepID=A0A0C3APD4_SERVB|nr:hypothetical protein M408DRAFT_111686 [Serendipita vermifera MAFF 305830]